MLHCPRCSGPLAVTDQPELRGTSPQPAAAAAAAAGSSSRVCPAGHHCPHQSATSTAESVATSKSVNYLSGGGIWLVPPNATTTTSTRSQSITGYPNPQLPQPSQLESHRLSLQLSTTLAPMTGHFHHTGAGLLLQSSSPLFLTSTVPGALGQPSAAILSHPPTPAIVVGSSGSPFFSSGATPVTVQQQMLGSMQPQLLPSSAPVHQNQGQIFFANGGSHNCKCNYSSYKKSTQTM